VYAPNIGVNSCETPAACVVPQISFWLAPGLTQTRARNGVMEADRKLDFGIAGLRRIRRSKF
jgi:hypothetical protein